MRTHYHVEGESPFVLLIGRHSPPLERVFANSGCSCAAYLTAWNPMSRLTDRDRNLGFQRQLEEDLAEGGWRFIPGFGQGADGDWPPEPSFLVLGIPLEAAKLLAGKYRQNAFVWCPGNAVPELVSMR